MRVCAYAYIQRKLLTIRVIYRRAIGYRFTYGYIDTLVAALSDNQLIELGISQSLPHLAIGRADQRAGSGGGLKGLKLPEQARSEGALLSFADRSIVANRLVIDYCHSLRRNLSAIERMTRYNNNTMQQAPRDCR